MTCTRTECLRSRCIQSSLLAAEPSPSSRLLAVDGDARRVRVRDGGTWPESTDLWCWYCCHRFDTAPLPLPIRYDDKRDTFHVMGTFCSWACMKSHNLESSSYMKSVITNIITLFRKRCTGKLSRIRAAPPKHALRVFGGTMNIDEFRAASDNPVEYTLLPPHMIVHCQAIQETDVSCRAPPKKADLNAVVDFKNVATKNETLRLKRPKPLQNNRNLLERTMGINALAGMVD